jgi:hypothetical protein
MPTSIVFGILDVDLPERMPDKGHILNPPI